MTKILIRKAKKSDMQTIEKLLSTYFLDMEDLELEDFLLYEIDGKITGCISLIKTKFRGENIMEIHSIAVHPNFRGKGIGTKLVKHLLKNIENSSFDFYARTTVPRFFEKLDFVKIENSEKFFLWEDCKSCDHFEKCTQYAMKYSYNPVKFYSSRVIQKSTVDANSDE
jgi:amino-acid N-acetyltransferase